MPYNYNRDENYTGFNHVNWYGQVEDRNDPLRLGRVRVRIFGWHNLDPVAAPVELLPWAQLQLAPNAPRTFSGPKMYEWVTGYFIDGASGQFPVVTGILPGINLELKPIPLGAPRPPSGIVLEAADTPSTPPLAAGVLTNSLIAKTNKEIVHICDISPQVKQVTGWIKVKFGYIANLIREKIRAILKALGADPTGESSSVVSFLKKIAAYVKRITEILTDVQNWKDVIVETARVAGAIVKWITDLPKRFLEMLSDCLSNLYKIIAGGFQEILSMFTVDTKSAFAEINKAVDEIKTASNILIDQVQDLASAPGQIVNAFTNPGDDSVAQIDAFVSSQISSTATYTDNPFSGSNTERP